MEKKSELEIVEVREVTPSLCEAIERLMPQLAPRSEPPSTERLRALLLSPASSLLTVLSGGRIAGMLTLVWYDTPSGRKAWIEDVVVDSSLRGCGAGEALVRRALERAAAAGADRVMLTSSPKREAARALYRKIGFEEAETTVFVYRGPAVAE